MEDNKPGGGSCSDKLCSTLEALYAIYSWSPSGSFLCSFLQNDQGVSDYHGMNQETLETFLLSVLLTNAAWDV